MKKYYSQGGQEYPTYNKKKANWTGHVLRRNRLLKRVTEGRTERRKDFVMCGCLYVLVL